MIENVSIYKSCLHQGVASLTHLIPTILWERHHLHHPYIDGKAKERCYKTSKLQSLDWTPVSLQNTSSLSLHWYWFQVFNLDTKSWLLAPSSQFLLVPTASSPSIAPLVYISAHQSARIPIPQEVPCSKSTASVHHIGCRQNGYKWRPQVSSRVLGNKPKFKCIPQVVLSKAGKWNQTLYNELLQMLRWRTETES